LDEIDYELDVLLRGTAMVDKYEISLWEDYPDTTTGGIPFLNERKLCVIGSDTMNT